MSPEKEELVVEILSEIGCEAIYHDNLHRKKCCHFCEGGIEHIDGGRYFIHSERCLTHKIDRLRAMS